MDNDLPEGSKPFGEKGFRRKNLQVLAVDVGTGTQDILLFDTERVPENCFKMVMPSPTVTVAKRIRQATGRGTPLLLTGVTMGGGPCSWAADAPSARHRKCWRRTCSAFP